MWRATNQLSQLIDSASGTTNFGYDVQSNLATRGTYVYNFDYSNRLRGINGLERYRYNGPGRRSTRHARASTSYRCRTCRDAVKHARSR